MSLLVYIVEMEMEMEMEMEKALLYFLINFLSS